MILRDKFLAAVVFVSIAASLATIGFSVATVVEMNRLQSMIDHAHLQRSTP